MNKEILEKEGKVQAIKKDRTALELDNQWFQSKFLEIPSEVIKGSSVKISFTINGAFNNLKSIELVESENIKEKEVINLDKISDSSINTLVMTSKDIFIAMEGKKSLKDVTTDVIASYKQIVENISK